MSQCHTTYLSGSGASPCHGGPLSLLACINCNVLLLSHLRYTLPLILCGDRSMSLHDVAHWIANHPWPKAVHGLISYYWYNYAHAY